MGRMLEALKQQGEGRLASREKPFFEDSLEREPHVEAAPAEEIPYIEVGAKKLDCSPSVLGAKPAVQVHPPQPKVQAPHHAPTALAEKKPLKADLVEPRPLSVAFEPWPAHGKAGHVLAPEIIAYHHPDHPVSVQYASLIEKMLEGHTQSQALLLVGSRPQVGTSTVLLNLAVCAAQRCKRRVVVIDAHWRRPVLAQRLGFSQAACLRDVFQGKTALEQAVVATPVHHLHLVPAQATATPAALSPEAVRWLFAWLRERFDLLLIDGPALDTGGELATLAPLCDGVYLVLPQQENAQMQRTHAHTLSAMGARLRGLIHTQNEV